MFDQFLIPSKKHRTKSAKFLILLENYFETKVNVPRVKHGKRQEFESAINEEAMLLASFIRGQRIWEPRIVPLPNFIMPRMFLVKRSSQPTFQPFFQAKFSTK